MINERLKMKEFILSADAGCDLTPDLQEKYDVEIMPLRYNVNGEEYLSGDGKMPSEKICEQMKAGAKTSTSQANPAEAEVYLEELLKRGKDIVHITMSSAMSGTYETMKRLAETLNETHDNKVYVVDSLCQCAGYGLLLAMVSDKANAGDLDAKAAAEYAESIRLHIIHNFSVDTLTYLARGGRVPAYLATIGNLIKLKPVLHVDDSGKIVMVKKLIGRRRALDDLVQRFSDSYDETFKDVFISEAACSDDAAYVKGKIEERFPEVNVTVIPLGPVIVSHSGPGTLALFFTAESRMK